MLIIDNLTPALLGLVGATVRLLAAYVREVGRLPAEGMEILLAEAGFPGAVQFSQSLLIHAWFARGEK